jgi:C_GCAxxG_C_C family probable redox protein
MGEMSKKDEIAERVKRLAYKYEQDYGGCSQAVVGAFKEALGVITDEVFKASTGMGGGVGLMGHTCGALLGGVLVLSTYLGREFKDFPDPQMRRFESFRLAKHLVERFEAEYGSQRCTDIQTKIMGRPYDIWTERDAFLAAGGHDDKCPEVCANAAKWVVEILREEGLWEEGIG